MFATWSPSACRWASWFGASFFSCAGPSFDSAPRLGFPSFARAPSCEGDMPQFLGLVTCVCSWVATATMPPRLGNPPLSPPPSPPSPPSPPPRPGTPGNPPGSLGNPPLRPGSPPGRDGTSMSGKSGGEMSILKYLAIAGLLTQNPCLYFLQNEASMGHTPRSYTISCSSSSDSWLIAVIGLSPPLEPGRMPLPRRSLGSLGRKKHAVPASLVKPAKPWSLQYSFSSCRPSGPAL
mmetsp:Transcript_17022/g.50971  ORF Transcript_17022/g.50971 Transcript_17022/m.50971 type:complete len:235 (-) Transcript_17022:695-1399(-)